MADQKFKSKVKLQGGVSLPAESISRALSIDANGEIKSSATTDTELGHLSGVTSSVQTQINTAQGDATQALADAGAAQADATQALADASTAQTAINNHLSDAVDAHDASAISNVPAGSIAATDVQAAINELDGDVGAVASDVADLVTLSGVAANSANLGTFTGSTIADSSTIKAALQALETELEGIPSPFYYAGTWAASTNTPTLANADTGVTGAVYYVSDAGSVDFGAGAISFAAGDRVANNGTTWDKWDMTDAVASVFGRAGAVTAQSGDYTASQITNVPAGSIAGVTVQAAIDELEGDVVAAQADATQALADAGTAQTAINNHLSDSSDAHDASAISVVPTGNLAASDVQSALNELQGDIDGLVAVAGDIAETSFSIANNQAAAASITGFAFSNTAVRSFRALVSIEIDATLDLWEAVELVGINKAGSFEMAQSGVGDESGVVLSITAGGQVQYTSANYAGFVAGLIRFRAIVTII